jgi:hypothetical protein
MHHTCKTQLKQTCAVSDGIMYFIIIQHIKGCIYVSHLLALMFVCLSLNESNFVFCTEKIKHKDHIKSETSTHSLTTIFLNMTLNIQVFWDAMWCL